ncbi:MAG: glycoside hydrolase family 38 [Verrucomicrobiota bacterium]
MRQLTFHLIANAHLDPVWLWDWREGLNEGIITCRTVLDLMDEFDDLTFIRGEAAVYQHIEQHDPKTFQRIVKHVASGRWDVVGGTVIQPDTNLPATETFARHFAHGQNYFISRFGRPARVAWAADSFGHSAGLPEVLADAGMTGFAFTRPSSIPVSQPAFWWEGPSGARVLAYHPTIGWYGSERAEATSKLDALLAQAQKTDLQNVGVFYGLGNHGGGPTRRQLADIRAWTKAHPEVRVVFSGLHRLFDALKNEKNLPVYRGELNFCLRGCYSSVAKFKYAYRKTEATLLRAERTNTVIASTLKKSPADLQQAWDTVLFNSFHDILPGSSIERAYDDQLAWLGAALHEAQRAEVSALNALALAVDTRVQRPPGDHPSAVAALVWNPHPYAFRGHVELEASLDYRPIWKYIDQADKLPVEVRDHAGKLLPFQIVATEHSAMPNLAWRKRVVVPVQIPALGWSVVEFGWVEGASRPAVASRVRAPKPGVIDNGLYRVAATVGAAGIQIFRKGKKVLGGAGLSAIVVEDPWGSWGGMAEEPDSLDLSTVREQWQVTHVTTLESGPERALLWVRLAGKRSRIDLSFMLYRGRDAVDVSARVFWDDRSARLKLVMPAGDRAEFEVPGGRVVRGPSGEVPGGRWVRVLGKSGPFGFASDALYNFDCKNGEFRATVVRASRYGNDVKTPPDAELWRPAVDSGELRFRFLINPGNAALPALAQELEQPPVVLLVPAKPGKLPRTGSLATLTPATVQILALKKAEDGRGLILRVQETSGKACTPQFTWLGKKLKLGKLAGNAIASWRITRRGARQTSISEL